MALERQVFFAIGNVINNKTSWTTLSCVPFEYTYGVVSVDNSTGNYQPLLGGSITVNILAVDKVNNTATITISGVAPSTGVPIDREMKISLNDAQNIYIPEIGTTLICGIADLDATKPEDTINRINRIAGTNLYVTSNEPGKNE